MGDWLAAFLQVFWEPFCCQDTGEFSHGEALPLRRLSCHLQASLLCFCLFFLDHVARVGGSRSPDADRIVSDRVSCWAAWTTRRLLRALSPFRHSCVQHFLLALCRGAVVWRPRTGVLRWGQQVSTEQRLCFQDVRGLILLGINSSHSVLDASASPYGLGDQTAPISCCVGLRVRELFPTAEQLVLSGTAWWQSWAWPVPLSSAQPSPLPGTQYQWDARCLDHLQSLSWSELHSAGCPAVRSPG